MIRLITIFLASVGVLAILTAVGVVLLMIWDEAENRRHRAELRLWASPDDQPDPDGIVTLLPDQLRCERCGGARPAFGRRHCQRVDCIIAAHTPPR